MASIIQAQMVGGKLIPVEKEKDIENEVKKLKEERELGCFLYGAGE